MKKTIKTDDLVTAMTDLETKCRKAEYRAYMARLQDNNKEEDHWVSYCEGIRGSLARLEELLK